jgi:PIN domain nuclease of toxin-antitoxin system
MRVFVASGTNFVSVVSFWEVLIKNMTGKLDVGDPSIWWAQALLQLAAIPIDLRPDHVKALYSLPPIHKDPFDRILIAQATAESLTLLTTDRKILQYASPAFQVIQA